MNGLLVGKIHTYESGKFAHIPGLEGNKIELREPDAGYESAAPARPLIDRP